MQLKFIFLTFLTLIFWGYGLKSKQLIISGDEFSKGKFSNSYVNEVGYLGLTPTCEKIHQLDEAMIWRVLKTKKKTYIATGHNGKLYEISPTGEQKIYSATSQELIALLSFKGDLLIGSGPQGIVYRLKKNAKKLEKFSILPVSFIWDMIPYGDGILVATGNKGAIYQIDKKGEKKSLFQSPEDNILKLAFHGEKIYASTSGQGYLYEIQKSGQYKILYDAGGRDINDFIFIGDKIYLVTSGKKELPINNQKISIKNQSLDKHESPAENNHFENLLVEVDIEGGFAELYKIKNQTILTLISVGEDKLYFGTSEKGEVYSYDLSKGQVNMLYAVEDASITHLYKRNKEVYFSTGTGASLYRASLSYSKIGEYVSQVFDLKRYATWGRVNLKSTGDNNGITIFARTGNSFDPNNSWSEWEECENDKIKNSHGRFIQIKLIFSSNKQSAKISSVEINLSYPNTRPSIEYFRTDLNTEIEKAYKISLNKNEKMLSWKATDEDKDELLFRLYYKLIKHDEWLELEKEIKVPYFIVNSLTFPNGDYEFKLIVTDEKSSDPKNAYYMERISSMLSIDNQSPIIKGINVFDDRVEFIVLDEYSVIEKLKYSTDKKTFKLLYPVDKVFDDKEEQFIIERKEAVKEIIIYGEDRAGNILLKTLKLK